MHRHHLFGWPLRPLRKTPFHAGFEGVGEWWPRACLPAPHARWARLRPTQLLAPSLSTRRCPPGSPSPCGPWTRASRARGERARSPPQPGSARGLPEGETVPVTAAAGRTGQFAVRLAKKATCHVTGTRSAAEKRAFLRSAGCGRPISYNAEHVGAALRQEHPQGWTWCTSPWGSRV